MKAMILAAGFGTRLWPLTIGRTKPAIPFLNRPLIAFTIDYLKRHGISDLIINLHHEPESVQNQIGDGSKFGARVSYSVEEPIILGTSGALDNVRHLLEDDTFIVVNGKIITDIDLGKAIEQHRQRGSIATLVLRQNQAREAYSEIIVDAEGHYQGYGPFPEANKAGPAPLMFTGIHILEPAIFDYIPRGVFSDSIRDVYPKAMANGKTIAVAVGRGNWYELSTLRRYLEISLEFAHRNGADMISDQGCQIAESADVTDSVLWRNVAVGSGAIIRRCIVGDGVRIGDGEIHENQVIVRADAVAGHPAPEKAATGSIQGDNYIVSIP